MFYSNWTLGIDVSHWQGTIDWAKAASAGVKFAITKGTDFYKDRPIGFVDKASNLNIKGMIENNILTGGYCWLQPKQDPTLQAKFYVEEFYEKHELDFPPILDFEDSNMNSPADMIWRAETWLNYVEQATRKTPIVYTSNGYMGYFTKTQKAFLAKYPLWIAHYIAREYPNIPAPWEKAMMWQYADNGSFPMYDPKEAGDGHTYGVSSYGLDMNWYLGTYAQLIDELSYSGEPEPEPEPEPTPEPEPEEPQPLFYVRMSAFNRSIHSSPSMWSPRVGKAAFGEVFPVWEEGPNKWLRIGENRWISGWWVKGMVSETK